MNTLIRSRENYQKWTILQQILLNIIILIIIHFFVINKTHIKIQYNYCITILD